MINFNELIITMGKYAQAQYPLEACGIITKDFQFVRSSNLSNRPKISFMIDPVLLVAYDDNIWGVFHSHTDTSHQDPSEEDLRHTIYSDLKFIVGNQNKFYIYWYDKERKIKRSEVLNESHCTNN